MLNKSCLICKHRVVLDRRMMIIDFEPKDQSNKEYWECKRVDINKLPNIREIVAASFKGEAVKAEVIPKECNEFTLRVGEAYLSNLLII